MSDTEFNVRIRRWSPEAKTVEGVVQALRSIADAVEKQGYIVTHDEGYPIRDGRGQIIGRFSNQQPIAKTDQPALASVVNRLDGLRSREFVARVATTLGSQEEWDAADLLEAIAADFHQTFPSMPKISDQSEDSLEEWCDVADDLGWEHDRPEREDEDEDDDDA